MSPLQGREDWLHQLGAANCLQHGEAGEGAGEQHGPQEAAQAAQPED